MMSVQASQHSNQAGSQHFVAQPAAPQLISYKKQYKLQKKAAKAAKKDAKKDAKYSYKDQKRSAKEQLHYTRCHLQHTQSTPSNLGHSSYVAPPQHFQPSGEIKQTDSSRSIPSSAPVVAPHAGLVFGAPIASKSQYKAVKHDAKDTKKELKKEAKREYKEEKKAAKSMKKDAKLYVKQAKENAKYQASVEFFGANKAARPRTNSI